MLLIDAQIVIYAPCSTPASEFARLFCDTRAQLNPTFYERQEANLKLRL